jgi:hypothetical protein
VASLRSGTSRNRRDGAVRRRRKRAPARGTAVRRAHSVRMR